MADLVEDLGAARHGRCTVEREPASGAMTRASVAGDRRRDHDVALEVGRPRLSAGLGAAPLARAIRLAAPHPPATRWSERMQCTHATKPLPLMQRATR